MLIRIPQTNSPAIERTILMHDALTVQELFKLLDENCENPKITKTLCDFIHQIFIDRIGCVRLIHFQGYSLSIIEVAVKNIASLRI